MFIFPIKNWLQIHGSRADGPLQFQWNSHCQSNSSSIIYHYRRNNPFSEETKVLLHNVSPHIISQRFLFSKLLQRCKSLRNDWFQKLIEYLQYFQFQWIAHQRSRYILLGLLWVAFSFTEVFYIYECCSVLMWPLFRHIYNKIYLLPKKIAILCIIVCKFDNTGDNH